MLYRVSLIVVSFCTKGFAYLVCWPRGRGVGLTCTRRFSFHEFYNFLPFNFFFWKTLFYPRHLPTLTPTTHTHDPRPQPTTHYPRPTTFSYTRGAGYGWFFITISTGNKKATINALWGYNSSVHILSPFLFSYVTIIIIILYAISLFSLTILRYMREKCDAVNRIIFLPYESLELHGLVYFIIDS